MTKREVKKIAYHEQLAKDQAYAMRDRVPEKAALVLQFIERGDYASAEFHAANLASFVLQQHPELEG